MVEQVIAWWRANVLTADVGSQFSDIRSSRSRHPSFHLTEFDAFSSATAIICTISARSAKTAGQFLTIHHTADRRRTVTVTLFRAVRIPVRELSQKDHQNDRRFKKSFCVCSILRFLYDSRLEEDVACCAGGKRITRLWFLRNARNWLTVARRELLKANIAVTQLFWSYKSSLHHDRLLLNNTKPISHRFL